MRRFRFGLTLAVCGGLVTPASAVPVNIVSNGGFETTTNGTGELVVDSSNVQQTSGIYTTSATGWYANYSTANAGNPFLFIVAPNTADSPGFGNHWDNKLSQVWGPNNGSANGFASVSPSGGNFLIADGDYHATAINQNLSGLVKGSTYSLTFNWAAAQWYSNTGATTEQYQVSLGGQTKSTTIFSLPSKGFSGWMSQVFTFTYDGSSSVLSFLAVGTPQGAPPMLMLDGVTLYDIPEPAAWTSLLAGIACVAGFARRRRAVGTAGRPALGTDDGREYFPTD